MLALFEMLLSFAAVVVFAVALNKKTKINIGLCPIIVLASTMVWYSIFACFDLLIIAGMLYFALSAVALGYIILERKTLKVLDLITPASVFFLLTSLAIIVYFAIRQPIPMEWDEFSFWSIAPKVVKTTGHIYTAVPGNLRVTTFVPGLIMLDYMFQFISSEFVPWKVFAAYDIMMFAIFAAVLSPMKKRDWHTATPLAIICLLTPFLLTVYHKIIYVSTVYMSSYSDIPMGMLFAAGMLVYFGAKHKTPAVLLASALCITAECLVKDMGFALCLIAAAIIGFDLLFIEKGQIKLFILKGIPAKIGWCFVLVGAPFAAFFGWAAHLSKFLNVSRFDIGGSANMGMVEMVLTGIGELFSPDKSEKFTMVTEKMAKAFVTDKIGMLGSGIVIVFTILVILLVAFIASGKGNRLRIGVFTILSSLGFIAFYIFNGFTYVYIFHDFQAEALVSYNRYIYPYYIGWFVTALLMLAISLKGVSKAHFARAFLLLFCFVAILRFNSFVSPQLSVIDYNDSYFAGMKKDLANIDAAKEVLTEDDHLFFVSQGDIGMSWFVHYYHFYPMVLNFSLGGGTLSNDADITALSVPSYLDKEEKEFFTDNKMTAEVFEKYLEDTECTAIYFDQLDQIFIDTYGHLFTDGLSGVINGETLLYEIDYSSDEISISPMEMEVVK